MGIPYSGSLGAVHNHYAGGGWWVQIGSLAVVTEIGPRQDVLSRVVAVVVLSGFFSGGDPPPTTPPQTNLHASICAPVHKHYGGVVGGGW